MFSSTSSSSHPDSRPNNFSLASSAPTCDPLRDLELAVLSQLPRELLRGATNPPSPNVPAPLSQDCLLRFLVARGGNVDKAAQMLVAHLVWLLRDFRPERILTSDITVPLESGSMCVLG